MKNWRDVTGRFSESQRQRYYKDTYLEIDEVKEILVKEYEKNEKPTGEFINGFCRTRKQELPADICFDMPGWMEGL